MPSLRISSADLLTLGSWTFFRSQQYFFIRKNKIFLFDIVPYGMNLNLYFHTKRLFLFILQIIKYYFIFVRTLFSHSNAVITKCLNVRTTMRKTSICLFGILKRNFGRVQLISKLIAVIRQFDVLARVHGQRDCAGPLPS